MSYRDISIVGGGVIGLSCAWRLAKRGAKVTLLERHECGDGASGAALGALWPPSPLKNKPLHQLHRTSLARFPAFAQELRDATGIDVGYQRCGRIELLANERSREVALEEVAAVQTEDAASATGQAQVLRVLTPEEVQAHEPLVNCPQYGALLCAATAQVNVASLLSALRIACERAGVSIREGIKVGGLDIRDGRVVGIQHRDESLACGAALITAGAWTSQIAPVLSEYAAVRPVRGQAVLLQADRSLFTPIVKKKSVYLLPRSGGQVVIGSTTEPEAGFDIRNTAKGVAGLMDGALETVPALAEAVVISMWAGLRPRALDHKPVLGAVPGVEGLFVAAGHYKNGIGMAPITSEIMADLIVNGSTAQGIEALLPRRFDEKGS